MYWVKEQENEYQTPIRLLNSTFSGGNAGEPGGGGSAGEGASGGLAGDGSPNYDDGSDGFRGLRGRSGRTGSIGTRFSPGIPGTFQYFPISIEKFNQL